MQMILRDLLKLFPEGSQQQINLIYPDNHCVYIPNPGFMHDRKWDSTLNMKVTSLDVELYTEESKTIALLVIGVKD